MKKKSIWEEDDALTPDRESLKEAWKRLFNEELNVKQAVQTIDYGDGVDYVMPNGYIAYGSYPGNSGIYQI